jgi:hypothetical protein
MSSAISTAKQLKLYFARSVTNPHSKDHLNLSATCLWIELIHGNNVTTERIHHLLLLLQDTPNKSCAWEELKYSVNKWLSENYVEE